MARLIDADALKEKIEQSDGEGTIARYCKRVLAECLDNDAPTIPAIPVEWLEAHKMECIDDWGVVPISIGRALIMWQKEQEAR